MNRNVGTVDRIARVLVGTVILLGALAPFAGLVNLGSSSLLWWWGIPSLLLLIAVALLLTGASGRSLVYRGLGIDTRTDDEPVEENPQPAEIDAAGRST